MAKQEAEIQNDSCDGVKTCMLLTTWCASLPVITPQE